MHARILITALSVVVATQTLLWTGTSSAAELLVGGATISITPDRPVALAGQMHTRIARTVESPCTATALALESRTGTAIADQAILVSCDLVAIYEGVLDEVRERVKPRLSGFDLQKLVLSATHTHTGPVTAVGHYHIPDDDSIMKPEAYREFLVDRLADVIAQAWESRAPGAVGWGMGHAVIAQNRRAVYADGTAQMYGATTQPSFRGIEGYEDHAVEVLFFWNQKQELIATAISVACPAQEVEGRSAVNADFWHEVREKLRTQHGPELLVLGWIGAAGDQSPHLMYRTKAEERMRELKGISRLDELAGRLVRAWEDALEGAQKEIKFDATLIHHVKDIKLPVRKVTDEEYADAKAQVASRRGKPDETTIVRWQQAVVDRYEKQSDESVLPMELHAIRLGDVAIATNQFELFTEYGVRIKARSPAIQTFVVQLAGPGTYLPTEVAVQGGGYSAIVQSSVVGPQGGDLLVEETVRSIEALWADAP